MEKSKKDRLSELPESLIFHILWFVPIKDVVRTTVLSKRWKNLWTTIPFFNLQVPYFSREIKFFENFVNRALVRWNGNRVLKFKIVLLDEMGDSIYVDSKLWVNFAKNRGVEELYIDMKMSYDIQSGVYKYMVPLCLCSCLSLKVLSFKRCNFSRLNGDVQWNQLKSLTITDCFGVTEHVINQILSGSPRLEVLDLSLVDRGEVLNLNIRSNSLKELSISKSLYHPNDLSLVSKLTVWTPILETLKIKGMPYGNCWLKNVSSLTHASLLMYGICYFEEAEANCDFPSIGVENGFLFSQDYIGDKASQILQAIQHVENITLFSCWYKVLEVIRLRCKHSSFPNVKFLKIGGCFDKYEQLVGLLEIFPQLERLVLQDKRVEYSDNDPEIVKYEPNNPESFLQQLRTIQITWTDGDGIFSLTEILLTYASKLEKMVFRVGKSISPNSLLSASKALLNMPRSSTNFTIDFQHMILNDRYPI